MGSLLARGALAVLALVVGAWLAVGLHAVDLEEQFESAAASARDGELSQAELAGALDALGRARRLSVDQGPLINEGFLLNAAKRPDDAAAVARRVIEREPENVEAWLLAYLTSFDDKQRENQAFRKIRALNPYLADVVR